MATEPDRARLHVSTEATESQLPKYPLVCSVCRPLDGGVLFLSGTRRITIRNHAALIWDLVEMADGQLPLSDVVSRLKALDHDEKLVVEVIADLVDLGIVADSRSLYRLFHVETNNPMRYNSHLRIPEIAALERKNEIRIPQGLQINLPSPVCSSKKHRFSCRAFADESLTLREYTEILTSANSQKPSAGDLRPLRFDLLVAKGHIDLKFGVYFYDSREGRLIDLNSNEVDRSQIAYALNEEQLLFGCSGVVVVAADIDRVSTKYANRGYRYALVEAGMAVERILATCDRLGLASLVYGGFNDEALTALIAADHLGIVPLICVAVGKPSSLPNLVAEELNDLYSRLEPFVGPEAPVRWASIITQTKHRGDLSFHQSLSSFAPTSHDSGSESKDRICGGTAASSLLARTKSIVEALERYVSGEVRVDSVGPSTIVNPRYVHSSFAPYTEEQIESQLGRLTKFEVESRIEWVRGTRLQSGEDFYVPIDIVFYPLSAKQLGRPLVAFANSSGVAAHSTHEQALKHALLELSERDAILRAWYTNMPPVRVDRVLWPHYIERRARYWQEEGFNLEVFEFVSSNAIVIGVSLRSNRRFPYFCFGSAATFDDPETAIKKAFHEAEVAVAGYRRESDPAPRILAAEVKTPLDHGLYYAQQQVGEVDAFFNTDELTTAFVERGSLDDLIAAWDPVEVDLDPARNVPIKIVRVFSAKAIPINFGYGLEHWSHAELDGIHRRSPTTPHFIA